MNQKVIDILFSILVFSLPFKYIPKLFWQTFLGGPFGQDLVVYPLLMGFVYTCYCQWKHRNVLYKWCRITIHVLHIENMKSEISL